MPPKKVPTRRVTQTDAQDSSDVLSASANKALSSMKKTAGRKPTAAASRGGRTRKPTAGGRGRKHVVSNQQANNLFHDMCVSFEEETKAICTAADEELDSRIMVDDELRILRAAVDDTTGESAIDKFHSKLDTWTNIGQQILNIYDQAEQLSEEHLAKEPAKVQRWELDTKGMTDIIDSGLEHSKRTIDHLLISKEQQQTGPHSPQRQSVHAEEPMSTPRRTISDAEAIAEETFGSKKDQEGWGFVARGHLKTWVGLLKGAQDPGFVPDEDE